ncbi:L-ascorbate peroxidase 3 [Glycine soja]|uniref:L-ascorbate peroxidase 3 n=1 Tax=Glycine soja TaxID=3848 RepID=A0A445HYN2_GLYSO|nr:L-ascorbate peroxidase 3 [Glycine soja]
MVEPIVVDEEYRKEIEMARRELGVFITNNKCAPLMLQFAYLTLLNYCFHVFLANSLHCLRWNDAATYDAKSRRGGPNGSIRLRIGQELKHEANKGLENAVQYCACGAVAVEVTKGPTIDFVPGRKDSNESPRTEGRFIDGEEDARNLRKIFSRMGLSDEQDIVALCGGHTLIRTMYPKVPMDEEIFFKEYAISHGKLSELGFNLNNLDQPKGPYAKLNQHKGLIGIGIASVVVTVILGYLLKRKKNQLKN